MKQEKEVLQSMLDKLAAQEQMIRSGLDQRIKSLEKLQQDIEQQKGALSYNLILADDLKTQLKNLAAKSEEAPAV